MKKMKMTMKMTIKMTIRIKLQIFKLAISRIQSLKFNMKINNKTITKYLIQASPAINILNKQRRL